MAERWLRESDRVCAAARRSGHDGSHFRQVGYLKVAQAFEIGGLSVDNVAKTGFTSVRSVD